MTTKADSRPEGASEGDGPGKSKGSLRILFVAVLVDLIGFGIILPLLPFYARDFGASALQIGLLVTVYSVVQLVMAPFWGRCSDRFGRRPVLILGLLGSGFSYLIFARADSLAALFISRIVGGFGGSTVPVAQAYIADVTTPAKRAGSMGLIGAAFGLGFVVGPALGGILSGVSFAAPGYAAAALCFTNALTALLRLPESREPGRGARSPRFNFGAALREAAASPQIRITLAVYLFLTMAFSALQPTLSLLALDRFSMGARQAGYLFAFLGIVSAVVQGGLVRRIVPRMGERTLLRVSTVPFALGLALAGWATSLPQLLLALALIGIGYGGTIPSALGLLSRAADEDRQGALLGLGQSVGSSARIVGPTLAGALFDIRAMFTYVVAAALVLFALSISGWIRQPEDSGVAPVLT